MAKITYEDKTQTGAYDASKFNAEDANEIKGSVNDLYDGGGSLPTKTKGAVEDNNSILINDINLVYQSVDFILPLLDNTKIGKEIIVESTTSEGTIKPSLGGSTISSDIVSGASSFYIIQKEFRYKFTYKGDDYWFVQVLQPKIKYKTYTALVSYNGTISTIVLNNELGASVVFAMGGGSLMSATLTGAFIVNKTFFINTIVDNGGQKMTLNIDNGLSGVNTLYFEFKNIDGTTTPDMPFFSKLPVEIRVYY